MVEAVIFDMDGKLVDYENVSVDAWRPKQFWGGGSAVLP